MSLGSMPLGETFLWRAKAKGKLMPVAERVARRLGAQRLSDITQLDELNVPCWQIFFPSAGNLLGNITVLNGKGWDAEQARLSALMEFIERYWAENTRLPLLIERQSTLDSFGQKYLAPKDVPLPSGIPDLGDRPIAWVNGRTLEGEPIWVPAHEAFCPFQPPPEAANPAIWNSTGLAAGTEETETIFYGLLETIERDAVAMAEWGHIGTSVDLTCVTCPRLNALRSRLVQMEIALEVKRLSAVGGVSAFVACLDDRGTRDPMQLIAGYGAHLDPFLAMERAVLEAVQARATVIAGAREDLDEYQSLLAMGYEQSRSSLAWWFDQTDRRVEAPTAPSPPPESLALALNAIRQNLATQGFEQVVVVKLSPPDAEIVVLRVIVPGCSHATSSYWRFGKRFVRC